jgi:DnaD/phage-associated family protein
MSANGYEELRDFLNNGINAEMVEYAVNIARDNGSIAWSYARTIMDSWVLKGIKTLQAAKTEVAQFKSHKQSSKGKARAPTADTTESVYGGYVNIPPTGG